MVRDVFHADHGGENQTGRESPQRHLGLHFGTAGEDGEVELLVQLFECAGLRHPPFAQHQATFTRAVAEEQTLEMRHHIFERGFDSGFAHQVVGELPIVVPAAGVLHFLDALMRGPRASEMLHGARDGLAVRFGDIYQDAIHVENQQGFVHCFQISSSAASICRVCSRVPTVIRTQPGAS